MFILRFLNKAVSCSEPLVAQLIEPGRVRVRRSRVFGYRRAEKQLLVSASAEGPGPQPPQGIRLTGMGGNAKQN